MVEPDNNEESGSESPKAPKRIIGNIMFFVVLITVSLIVLIGLAGIGVFGYQIYFWLMQGYWKPLPATILLEKILSDNFWVWLADDTAWVGLKKVIVSVINSSLGWFLIIFAFIFGWLGGALIAELDTIAENAKKGNLNKCGD